MNFFYNNRCLVNPNIDNKINEAAKRLYEKLLRLELNDLNISEYNKRYLGNRIKSKKANLQLYTHLLSLSLKNLTYSFKDIVLVDYGGGAGLFSLLAKELGIGTVIYNDIFDTSCDDFRIISNKLKISIDSIVPGDIGELIDFVSKNNIKINSICSFDVIEHIYDVSNHINNLEKLSDGFMNIVYASSANIKNKRIMKSINKIHYTHEYIDREKKTDHKERDLEKSFFKTRIKIIKNYNSKLDDLIVEKLAKKTRGLIKKDIEKCIDEYIKKGLVSYEPDKILNTCDPYTGNWAENVMSHKWLVETFNKNNLNLLILPGFYLDSNSYFKNLIKYLLNSFIKYFKNYSMFIAPYYILYSNKKINQTKI